MIWISKYPPIYIFIGDIWMRETDKKKFRMRFSCFLANDEVVKFTDKTKLCLFLGDLDERI